MPSTTTSAARRSRRAWDSAAGSEWSHLGSECALPEALYALSARHTRRANQTWLGTGRGTSGNSLRMNRDSSSSNSVSPSAADSSCST